MFSNISLHCLQGANIFDHLPNVKKTRSVASEAAKEIERYLSTATLKTDNPLQWWTENAELYPTLSWMALDYLSIPGTYLSTPWDYSESV